MAFLGRLLGPCLTIAIAGYGTYTGNALYGCMYEMTKICCASTIKHCILLLARQLQFSMVSRDGAAL